MIIWFSGTGNSRAVAFRLADLLRETDLLQIDRHYKDEVCCLTAQERIIWVCPVYGWRIPPVVADAVMSMPENIGRKAIHWLVTTCGDDIGETPRYWRRLLSRRGWQSGAVYSVAMPNTYVFLPGFDVDKPEIVAQKLEAMPGRVGSIARAIAGREYDVDWVRPGAFPALKSRMLWPVFSRWLMRPDGFNVSRSRCIGCEACVRVCPMNNISLTGHGNTPVWGKDCAFCTACYQVCPVHAISHGIWSHGKGQQMLSKENITKNVHSHE